MVCEDPLGCLAYDKGQSIQIAAALPLSGRQREVGIAWFEEIERAAESFHGTSGLTFTPVPFDLNCSPENSQEVANLITAREDILLVVAAACDPFDQQFAQWVSDAGQSIVWLASDPIHLSDLPPGNFVLFFPSTPVDVKDEADGMANAASLWVFEMFEPPLEETSMGGFVLGRQAIRSRLEQTETIESSGWKWDCSPERSCLLIHSGVN